MNPSFAVFTLPTRLSVIQYSLIAWPVALFPSALLLALGRTMAIAGGLDGTESIAPLRGTGLVEYVAVVLLAPILETVVLGLGIAGLHLLGLTKFFVAIVSAVIWGLLHGVIAPLWFFGTVWSFFVFSVAFLVWRAVSWRHAFIAAVVPHALLNATAMAVGHALALLQALPPNGA